jgi:DNA repair photolyase
MGLNKSKGNMYEWITHTWNTIKGACPHECTYCYMHRWGKLKEAHFDQKELKTDLGKGNYIFVGSSCDMFANDIPVQWIIETLEHMSKFPDNRYLIQTKNPKRVYMLAVKYGLDKNISICTTLETNRMYPDIMKNSPHISDRAMYMNKLSNMGFKTLVTIEPIMKFDLESFLLLIRLCQPEQVNIGADSGNNNLPEPTPIELHELINSLQIKHKLKSNLKRLLS